MKNSRLVFFTYFLLVFAFFIKLPLNGELPGNTDTLLAIALSNLFVLKIKFLISGVSSVTALYPSSNPWAYGENCYGLSLLFLVFKLFNLNDIWSYFFFITIIFTLNSFAIYKWSSLYLDDLKFAFLAGIAFSWASFIIANIDDPNVIFIFFPAMAFYFLERAIREKNSKFLKIGLVFSGVQIWFGFYVFFFQFLALLIFVVLNIKNLHVFKKERYVLLLAYYILPALPLVAIYIFNHFNLDLLAQVYNNPLTFKLSSLSLKDFWNISHNTLLYSRLNKFAPEPGSSHWVIVRKGCFMGVIFPAFTIVGIIKAIKKTHFLILILVIFTVLSFGANIPFLELIQKIPLGQYFRVPLRFYLFSIMSMSIYFSIGVEYLSNRIILNKQYFKNNVILFSIFLIYMAENAPFPMHGYEFSKLILPSKSYVEFFKKFNGRKIILDLPTLSNYPSWRVDDSKALWFYNREMLYMNWVTAHGQIVVGGVNGYLPKSRVRVDEIVQQLPGVQAFVELKKIGINYLVFHKKLILAPEENILATLKSSAYLKLSQEDDDLAIFKLL